MSTTHGFEPQFICKGCDPGDVVYVFVAELFLKKKKEYISHTVMLSVLKKLQLCMVMTINMT